MDLIFKNYDKVLSIGSSCFVKSFLQSNNIQQETNFFDYIGSSMWGICDLIENNFEGLSNIEDYDLLHISDNLDIFSNKKYYLRLKHQNFIYQKNKINIHAFKNMCNTFERRAERFENLLRTMKRILFIRMEQDDSKRFLYDEYKDKNNGNELSYVISFAKILKEKYHELEFNILFISKSNDNLFDTDNNILILKNKYEDMNWDDCNEKLNNICNYNLELIKNL